MNVTKQLYQWDTGQKLTECTGIYVDYLIGAEVYRVEITDGTCIIPDELLQTSGRYKVWECMADNTLREFAFKVLPRPIPPNYVFTPTEQLTFEGLVQKETNKFNTNAIEKLNAYNANADNRVAEFNAQTEQIQTDVSELKSDLAYISQYDTLDVPYTVQNWYIDETGKIASHNSARALIIPCKANTKYIVTKTAGTRYAVGCTSIEPSVGSSCTVFKVDSSASNIELQTDENAKYLVAYVWYNTDTISDTEMIASVRFNMFCAKVSENIITKVNDVYEQSLTNKHSIENLFYLLSKATFATEPHNTKDYEEKNNPVIDGAWRMKLDADHTGYVQCNKTFSPSGTWEIGIRFLPTAKNTTGYYDLITTSVDGTIEAGIIIEGSNYDNGTLSYSAFIKKNGDSSNTKISLGVFQFNKWIEINLWYDNGYVYSKVHQDSYTYENYVSVGQISSGFTVEFGRVKNGIFVGQIDLSETYIKQNGEMWWRAVK